MGRAQNTVKRGTFWRHEVVGGWGGGPSLLRRGENCRTAMPRPGGPWPEYTLTAPTAPRRPPRTYLRPIRVHPRSTIIPAIYSVFCVWCSKNIVFYRVLWPSPSPGFILATLKIHGFFMVLGLRTGSGTENWTSCRPWCQHRANIGQDVGYMGQHKAKIGASLRQHRANIGPRWPNIGPTWLQDGPRRPNIGPRWPQDGPTWAQHGPKMAQHRPNMAPRSPNMTPRWLNIAPRWPDLAPT